MSGITTISLIYAYDEDKRLTSVHGPSSVVAFSYDGLGNRYRQIENGVPTTYTLDTSASLSASLAVDLSQVLSDGEYTYLYGLTRFAQQSTASTDYFLPDALGSVRQLYNQGGGIGLTQTFDPFGNLLSQEGSLSSHYGFAGEWSDVTGLQHLRARYYSPIQGRFMNRDPFQGFISQPNSLNPYVYALNNPVNLLDPNGLYPNLNGGDGNNGTTHPVYWMTPYPTDTNTPSFDLTQLQTKITTIAPTATSSATPLPSPTTTPISTPTIFVQTPTPGPNLNASIDITRILYDGFFSHFEFSQPSALYPLDLLSPLDTIPGISQYVIYLRFALHITMTGRQLLSCLQNYLFNPIYPLPYPVPMP